ncbi:hypothetical protein LB467_01065 [Salegentibacter sp. JZCK2]|uniref:hypothetical protein n=1 Tax=Salegentibacter tibetensis TaxID=2873600 RepID=UPI001CC926FE|nr:hypothetical protein [Salegentibacter tibetensis]MBZ9728264.1 hypothetical protein [Salegentibacter tibetensis]
MSELMTMQWGSSFESEKSEEFESFEAFSKQEEITIMFRTDNRKLDHFRKAIAEIEDHSVYKKYCILAVQNLLKKNHLLELSLELAEEQISEEDFENELDANPSKYTIDINYIENINDLSVISKIIQEVGQSFSVDEVSEIFSLDSEDIESKLSLLK